MVKKNILVIGDIMLDQYLYGDVRRISPEAPIPIVNVCKKINVLGGAANVANNIVALGSIVSLCGAIGCDKLGEELKQKLIEQEIDCEYLIESSHIQTITKSRVIGNHQQVVRLDYNDKVQLSHQDFKNIFEKLKCNVSEFELVVISDYNKGFVEENFCRDIIKLCEERNIKVIVDPKGICWNKYSGASIITPNLKEVSSWLGKDIKNDDLEIEINCRGLNEKCNVKSFLITRSEKGMTLFDSNSMAVHFSSFAKDVYDVSGAGDTVVATLAVYLSLGKTLYDAIEMANKAAGIVVGKQGTSVVYKSELEEIGKQNFLENKILLRMELINRVKAWKQSGNTIAVTNGCFDILHRGHIYSLYQASMLADKLIVAVNSNDSVKRLKGSSRPINDEYDRAYVLAGLACVDAITIFEEDTPEEILSQIRPNILVKGGDYTLDSIKGKEYAERVEIIPTLNGFSSTSIIRNINKE